MLKNDFVNAFAEKTGRTKKESAEIYDTFFEVVQGALSEGEDVMTPIGKFKIVERDKRMVRNPQTNEMFELPVRKALKFQPNANLKDAIKSL